VSAIDSLSTGGEDLVADIRRRIARFDERINADVDEVKSELLARLGEMEGLAERLDTLERSLASIEKATVHLDQTMTGMVESLPDFMSRRIKPEGGGNPPGAT
jgi:predicted  nucleic acid-binding Zn-ribbon protein